LGPGIGDARLPNVEIGVHRARPGAPRVRIRGWCDRGGPFTELVADAPMEIAQHCEVGLPELGRQRREQRHFGSVGGHEHRRAGWSG
jgi:hypothetical protein